MKITSLFNLKKIVKYLTDKKYRFAINDSHGFYNCLSDEKYLKKAFNSILGYPLNLSNPQTYNEKLQWLKLHNRKPIYTTMVDKASAKEYVANKIGEEYIIPTLGIYNNFDEIDFTKLPNQFVLKCTHDSGGLVICRDKSKLDIKSAKKKITKCLKKDYYLQWREWPYKDVPHKIIAEQYMEDEKTHDLRDYKFFCFNGKVKALFIATERQNPNEETKFDFFDENFHHLPIKNGHDNAKVPPEKPINFELMKTLAEKLSDNTPHLRVDFYEINGKVYFGEMTFYHWSGLVPFEPAEWDKTFGEWIEL